MAITTNKEYISATLQGLNLSETDIDLILLKASLTGTGTVDVNACDLAIYNRLSVVLKGALQNVSEGGMSITWNMEAVKLYYSALCSELDKPSAIQPKIRNRSNYW